MDTPGNSDRPGCLLVQGRVTDREGFEACSAALPPIGRNYGGGYLALLDGLPAAR